MTDWLPFAFVLTAAVFTVLGLLVDALDEAGADASAARRAFWTGLGLTGLVFAVYLVAGESWIWY